jgi:hypothetical protein
MCAKYYFIENGRDGQTLYQYIKRMVEENVKAV